MIHELFFLGTDAIDQITDVSSSWQYTVAPAVTATVVVILFAYSSDYFRERSYHMAVPCMIGLIGYVILMTVEVEVRKNIGYLAIFFCTMGVRIHPPPPPEYSSSH